MQRRIKNLFFVLSLCLLGMVTDVARAELVTEKFEIEAPREGKLVLPPISLTYDAAEKSFSRRFRGASIGFDIFERLERNTSAFKMDDLFQNQAVFRMEKDGRYIPYPLNLRQFRVYFDALTPGKSTPLENTENRDSVLLEVSETEFSGLERDTVFEYPEDVFSLGITRRIDAQSSWPVLREFMRDGLVETGDAFRMTISYPIYPHDVQGSLNPFKNQKVSGKNFEMALSLVNLLIPVVRHTNSEVFIYELMRAKMDFVPDNGFDGLVTVYAGGEGPIVRPFKKKGSYAGPFQAD